MALPLLKARAVEQSLLERARWRVHRRAVSCGLIRAIRLRADLAKGVSLFDASVGDRKH